MRPIEVFISYSRKDEDFAHKLHDFIIESDHEVWIDTEDIRATDKWPNAIDKALKKVNAVVWIMTPDSLNSEQVQLEMEWAFLAKKDLIFLWLKAVDEDDVSHLFRSRQRVDFRTDKTRGFVTLKRELDTLSQRLFPEDPPGTDPQHPKNRTMSSSRFLFNIPPLPGSEHFLPCDITEIKKSVISNPTHKTAIYGMGGVGKTVLATALAHNADVQTAFPDGIFWIHIGFSKQSLSAERYQQKLLECQRVFLSALEDQNLELADVPQNVRRLEKLLSNKTCLIILDDIWEFDQIVAFDTLNSQGRMLITTRNKDTLQGLAFNEHPIGNLDENQALILLANYAGLTVDTLPHQAAQIAKACGYLPLALAMIGTRVKNTPLDRWQNVLNRLKNADLEKFNTQFPNYPYPTLFAVIEISVETLNEEEPRAKARYLDFAVFAGNVPIPEDTLKTFWARGGVACTPEDSQDIIDKLVSRSLLRRDMSGNLTIHDLQSAYVRKKTSNLQQLHSDFVNAYRQNTKGGWHTISDDGYFYDHLIHHLEQAQRFDEIHNLIYDKNWVRVRAKHSLDTVGSVVNLLRDFEHAKQLLKPSDEIAIHIRYALFDEVVRAYYRQIPTNVLIPFLKESVVGDQTFMTAVRSMYGGYDKQVQVYLDILPTIPIGSRDKYADESIKIVREVTYPDRRFDLITELMFYLPASRIPEAQRIQWCAAFLIKEEALRKQCFDTLFSSKYPLTDDQYVLLQDDLFKVAHRKAEGSIYLLTETKNIIQGRHQPSDDSRLRVIQLLLEVIEYFPKNLQNELWLRALEFVFQPNNTIEYVQLLCHILPKLPVEFHHYWFEDRELIWQELGAVDFFRSVPAIKYVVPDNLESLLPFIAPKHIKEIWDEVSSVVKIDPITCGSLMIKLVPYLPESLLSEYETYLGSISESDLPQALIALAPQLKDQHKQLETYRRAWTESVKTNNSAIRQVAQQLPETLLLEVWGEICQKTSSLHHEYDQKLYQSVLNAFQALVPCLPIYEIQGICREFSSNWPLFPWDNANLIQILINRLPIVAQQTAWQEVLEIALRNSKMQSVPFGLELLARMPEDMQVDTWEIVLAAVRSIERPDLRSNVFMQKFFCIPITKRPAIWLEAWDVINATYSDSRDNIEEKAYCLRSALQHITIIYDLIPEKTRLDHTNWDMPAWDHLLEHFDFDDEFCALGLMILAKHAPDSFIERTRKYVWQKNISHQHQSKDFTLLLGLYPLLSLEQREKLFQKIALKDHLYARYVLDSTDDLIGPIIVYWPDNLICEFWGKFCSEYDNDGHRNLAWGRKLITRLPIKDTLIAWEILLKVPTDLKLSPTSNWQELCCLLASRIPSESLANVLNNVEHIQNDEDYRAIVEPLKTAIMHRLPQEMAQKLWRSRDVELSLHAELPNDIFMCGMARYIQYGGPWFGTHLRIIDKDPQIVLTKLLPHYDAKPIFATKQTFLILSYLTYLTIPLIYTETKILYPILTFRSKLQDLAQNMDYWAKSWITMVISDFAYSFLLFLINIIPSVSLIRHSRPTFTREVLFHLTTANCHAISKAQARDMLIKCIYSGSPTTMLVIFRPLLQRIGRKKLRKTVQQAYGDSRSWWKKEIAQVRQN